MTAVPAPTVVERVLTADEATLLVGAEVDDHPPTITAATVAVDADGEPLFAYLPLGDVGELRQAVRSIAYTEGMRHNGLRNMVRAFGSAPRRPVRFAEGCNTFALARDHPAEHAVLDRYAGRLHELLRAVDPRLPERAEQAVAEVLPEWRLADSSWTSGVVNRTSPLPYHRDRGNFPVWSAMPVLRRGVTGGHLHLPEYGATIACRDGWVVLFAGYALVHGVTPMRLTAPDGYRYSVVYYSLRAIKDCGTAAAETRLAMARRTERERRAAAEVHARVAAPARSHTIADEVLPSAADVTGHHSVP